VGTGFVVWFLSSLAPRLLRVNLKAESRRLEAEMSGVPKSDSGTTSAYREWDVRAFRLPDGSGAGLSVADFENAHAPDRVFVERIRRGDELIVPDPATGLRQGDIVAVAARRSVLLARRDSFGAEVHDKELLDFPPAARTRRPGRGCERDSCWCPISVTPDRPSRHTAGERSRA